MINKVDSSFAVTAESGNNPVKPIKAELALQMLETGKIKTESLQFKEGGVVTFADKSGNLYRTELTPEQVETFKKGNAKNEVKKLTTDKLSLDMPKNGPAMVKADLFEDKDLKIENLLPEKKNDDSWKFSLNFGFNRTKYFSTDMHLKSSRMDVTIKDFEFKERTSASFYNPKTWQQFQDGFRWIDEPTNSFIFNAEKGNNVFYVTAFHPKFLKEDFQDKHVTGTVDGIAVDQVMPINEQFDGYNNQPGEMHLTRFENTHMQMDWQVGYGRNITLLDANKYGKLVYTPSVHAGVTTGQHLDVYVKEGEYWEFNDYKDKNRVQGANVSVGNRLKYEVGKFNTFVENRFNFSHLEHPFMEPGGKASYNMMYTNTTFGIGYQFYQTKPKNKPEKP